MANSRSMPQELSQDAEHRPHRFSRRELLGAGGALLLGGSIASGIRAWSRHEHGMRSEVAIARAASYDVDLIEPIMAGCKELGIDRKAVRGKRILLKPNLVETARGQTHINTNPAVVVAVAEVFRSLDAAHVLVAEGQGHRRDSWIVLDESGMGRALDEAKLEFVDLNHDDVAKVPCLGGWTSMSSLHLPKTLLRNDWVVSLPKLKTHHWTGITCAMKNLFGVMPGIVYGWPKNVLHHEGISESILDINVTVKPALAIVDGIVGMEGDGPIMGTPKQVGGLVIGRNLTAVDATCARLMGLNPYGCGYLKTASSVYGPIHERNITQRGESIASIATRFDVLDMPHLAGMIAS